MIDPDQDYCLSECLSCFVHHEVPGACIAEKKGWGPCGCQALNPASLQGQQVSTPDCSPASRTAFDFIFSNLFCFPKSIEASKDPKTHMLYQGQSELGDVGQGGPGGGGQFPCLHCALQDSSSAGGELLAWPGGFYESMQR